MEEIIPFSTNWEHSECREAKEVMEQIGQDKDCMALLAT
jgi:hypothetical protein